jgi:ABC-type transport system substrate-binding protein
MKKEKLTRRQLIKLSAMGSAAALAAACAPAPAAPAAEAPKPAEAPKAEEPKPTEAPKAEAPAANVPEVARNKTLIMVHGVGEVGVYNPWASPGYSHQQGNALMWEPLFYYALFSDKEYPWLAESGEYNADFTELTIKMRKGAEWSDGTPITSKDVVYTFENQLKDEKRNYHAAFAQFVKEVKAPDDATVVVSFKEPAPRFKFEVLSFHFDTGIPIVPAHVLSKEADVNAYKGDMNMPISGPYKTVAHTKDQKVQDLREDWWAIKTGLTPSPDVKRVVFLNFTTQDNAAQRVVNNEADWSLDLRNSTIKSVLEQNTKVTTHTGSEPPHGYLDWWPNSLWVNTQIEPFNDVNVRRAISMAINRDQIDEVIYEGAKVATVYPFPLYPSLQKFADSAKELEAKYQPRKFDLEESAKLIEGAGYKKNADGLWEKDGKTIPGVINGFESIHSDIVPVLVEQLRAAGIDASTNFGPDGYQNMADGKPGFYMFGHGASLKDPYEAFNLFHSKFAAPIGTTAGNNRFSRYQNPDYDKIIEGMAPLASDDPKFQELALQALEIYWRDVIDIPVIQWLHRIPYNQTYWTNYPTTANPALGFNGAYWHHTAPLVIKELKATGA